MYILEGQTLKSGWDDKWLWRDPQNSKYSVKSAYEILSSSTPGAFNVMFSVLWGSVDSTIDTMLCLEGITRQDNYKTKSA